MKKIYICGLQGQGKGLLRQLLDGHKKIFSPGFICIPGISLLNRHFVETYLPHKKEMQHGKQDPFYKCYRNGDITISVDDRTYRVSVGNLWTYLFRNELYNVPIDEAYADWSSLLADKSKDCSAFPSFEFAEFFRVASEQLLAEGHFHSLEQLQETIYSACISCYRSYPYQYTYDSYFLQISNSNGIEPIQSIVRRNERKKILIIQRDGSSSAHMNAERLIERQHLSRDSTKLMHKILFTPYEDLLYSRKYRKKYKQFTSQLIHLIQNESDIYVLQFDELIMNTRQTMDSIFKFLGIEINEINYVPTLDGKALTHPDGHFEVGRIFHDPERSLSRRQNDLLKHFYGVRQNKMSSTRKLRVVYDSAKLRLWQSPAINVVRRLVGSVLR